jgi:hypothetical protein
MHAHNLSYYCVCCMYCVQVVCGSYMQSATVTRLEERLSSYRISKSVLLRIFFMPILKMNLTLINVIIYDDMNIFLS